MHAFIVIAGLIANLEFVLGNASTLNTRPIVGILSQELPYKWEPYFPNYTAYIATSYVRYVESAGGRVVPILINQNAEYYDKIFQSINGLLIPGGSLYLDSSSYGKTGKIVYDMAKAANKNGDFFPVWGTCLGMELIAFLDADMQPNLITCSAQAVADPLNFTPEFENSRIFKNAPKDILISLINKNVTGNYHSKCLTPENFTRFGLDEKFRIISTNQDKNGLTYLSTLESYDSPVYLVQFHPEKNQFEWGTKHPDTLHTPEAIKVSQYMANFFISEVRKNTHRFADADEENKYLIHNYQSEYVGHVSTAFTQSYFFQ